MNRYLMKYALLVFAFLFSFLVSAKDFKVWILLMVYQTIPSSVLLRTYRALFGWVPSMVCAGSTDQNLRFIGMKQRNMPK